MEQSPGAREIRIAPSFDWASMPIAWQFLHLDIAGPFGWHVCDRDTLLEKIMGVVKSYETMAWREIPRKRLHPISVGDLTRQAQSRLDEIDQGDVEELYCLRVESKPRIWGIRDRVYFRVLWWDPNHQVYPVNVHDN